MMHNYKVGDKVVVNSIWGRFTGVVRDVTASDALVSYIAESGDICYAWFNLNQISLYDPSEFGILGEHHV